MLEMKAGGHLRYVGITTSEGRRHAEMLQPDGSIYTTNLRAARATDTYVCKGGGTEIWQPRFTFHGFQYIEVSGLSQKPRPDTVVGLALSSDTPDAGSFTCSDPMLNQLHNNVYWTQRANFIDIPTDCPQRDERLGWMGDAQVYIRTATYNADVAAFFTKWLDYLQEAQRDFGAYPDYCPYPMGHGAPGQTWGTAWTDAGIICPYTIWQVYGDTRVIERHWDSMARFMDWRNPAVTVTGNRCASAVYSRFGEHAVVPRVVAVQDASRVGGEHHCNGHQRQAVRGAAFKPRENPFPSGHQRTSPMPTSVPSSTTGKAYSSVPMTWW